MRIEYEADADDFNALALAVDAGPPITDRERRRAGFLPGWVPWVVLVVPIAAAVAYALVTQWRWQIDGPEFVRQSFGLAGRYEWLMPWALLLAAVLGMPEAKRRGRWTYSLATICMLALLAAGIAIAWAAARFATRPPLLAGLPLRWMPWTAIGLRLVAQLRDAWRPRDEARAPAPRAITFDDDFVTDEDDRSAIRFRWAALEAWHVSERLVLLYDADGDVATWFPKRAVGSAADLTRLTDVLRSRIGIEGRAFAVDMRPAD